MKRPLLLTEFVLLPVVLLVPSRGAQPQAQAPAPQPKAITTPKQHFGFNIGDDYCLVNYQQLMAYWAKLKKESDRFKVVTIGKTEEGRPQRIATGSKRAPVDFYLSSKKGTGSCTRDSLRG